MSALFRGLAAYKYDYDDEFRIYHGDRIAQLVVANIVQVKFEVSTELSKTARGSTGFGSTGID